MIICSKCTRVLMDVLDDGTTRIRTRLLLVDEDGDVTAMCPQCKTHHKLPLMLSAKADAEKPKTQSKRIKHVILKSGTKKSVAVQP